MYPQEEPPVADTRYLTQCFANFPHPYKPYQSRPFQVSTRSQEGRLFGRPLIDIWKTALKIWYAIDKQGFVDSIMVLAYTVRVYSHQLRTVMLRQRQVVLKERF